MSAVMRRYVLRPTRSRLPLQQSRSLTVNAYHQNPNRHIPADLGAEHKPSMGGSSFGHLISEISSTKDGMESQRQEGQTMNEEQRTFARRVVFWIMGIPVAVGTGFVGTMYLRK